MAELAGRWAVTANTVSRRLAYLGIKPIRQGNFRYLTVEQLEQANALHDHIVQGKPMEAFPRPEADASAVVRRLAYNSQKEDPTTALVAAMAARLAPVPDPLLQARRLKEAADLGVWLTNNELAAVLGVAESTLRDKSQDYSPRPGFTLDRRQERSEGVDKTGKPIVIGGTIWWRVRQEGGSVTSLATSGTTRQVGFGAIEASYTSIITLPCFDH
jgi:hypothetical protein